MKRVAVVAVFFAVVLVSTPVWLPWIGAALAVEEPLAPADVAVVLEGTGAAGADVAETWRQQGLVDDVVIVEAPVKTHALVAYWSDFVRFGVAAPAPTPIDHLRIVRAASTQAAEQARAVLPVLEAATARSVLIVGGGGIGSRLVERELGSVFGPAGITLRMVRYGGASLRDPARWYQNAEDRRAVLDTWLQTLVPFLSGYDAGS